MWSYEDKQIMYGKVTWGSILPLTAKEHYVIFNHLLFGQ